VKRTACLNFFGENFDKYYSKEYNPSIIPRGFLPVLGEEGTLRKPYECFSEASSLVMGVSLLHPEFKKYATKWGVAEHPFPSILIQSLKDRPPNDVQQAIPIFSYLSTRLSDFNENAQKVFSTLAFIPVVKTSSTGGVATKTLVRMNPLQVYFKEEHSEFQELFTYIDFGPESKPFLRFAGVKDTPSPGKSTILTLLSSNLFDLLYFFFLLIFPFVSRTCERVD
jgi:hypothetical protein